MEGKLELVVLPVSDVDRAKEFYADRLGFRVEVDYSPSAEFRVVQLTPLGSACSIALMRDVREPGSLKGLHLVVTDVDAARAELIERAGDVSEISEVFHFEDGVQAPGPDPRRGDYNSFVSFTDPDGNAWLVQERRNDPVAV